jgi:hypothetical protein
VAGGEAAVRRGPEGTPAAAATAFSRSAPSPGSEISRP